ncbi:hypothetical protein PTSG_03737 [Salpingoeca rosetta]|uniref:Uncharacterized protein n=1 Tax=Salpingoeca rosetta (strain ATCC 50818 / BSB-021) TaxID=946362 RepID=F2U6F6_SALR5|nr:uncharacterized protein PTSG_03737 [Salpingoeca rosetta]EGD83097.1 hypothetical protein PTSG_03737 [Salpingoeca rosetta]|eukprot:XP_004995461.1 hypothetical protein PTSG_03737 [Salpingoeca rosetta]
MAKLAARDHVDRFLRRELSASEYRASVVLFEPVVCVIDGRKKTVRWFVLTSTEALLLDNPPRKIVQRVALETIKAVSVDERLPSFLSKDIGDRAQHIGLHIAHQLPLHTNQSSASSSRHASRAALPVVEVHPPSPVPAAAKAQARRGSRGATPTNATSSRDASASRASGSVDRNHTSNRLSGPRSSRSSHTATTKGEGHRASLTLAPPTPTTTRTASSASLPASPKSLSPLVSRRVRPTNTPLASSTAPTAQSSPPSVSAPSNLQAPSPSTPRRLTLWRSKGQPAPIPGDAQPASTQGSTYMPARMRTRTRKGQNKHDVNQGQHSRTSPSIATLSPSPDPSRHPSSSQRARRVSLSPTMLNPAHDFDVSAYTANNSSRRRDSFSPAGSASVPSSCPRSRPMPSLSPLHNASPSPSPASSSSSSPSHHPARPHPRRHTLSSTVTATPGSTTTTAAAATTTTTTAAAAATAAQSPSQSVALPPATSSSPTSLARLVIRQGRDRNSSTVSTRASVDLTPTGTAPNTSTTTRGTAVPPTTGVLGSLAHPPPSPPPPPPPSSSSSSSSPASPQSRRRISTASTASTASSTLPSAHDRGQQLASAARLSTSLVSLAPSISSRASTSSASTSSSGVWSGDEADAGQAVTRMDLYTLAATSALPAIFCHHQEELALTTLATATTHPPHGHDAATTHADGGRNGKHTSYSNDHCSGSSIGGGEHWLPCSVGALCSPSLDPNKATAAFRRIAHALLSEADVSAKTSELDTLSTLLRQSTSVRRLFWKEHHLAGHLIAYARSACRWLHRRALAQHDNHSSHSSHSSHLSSTSNSTSSNSNHDHHDATSWCSGGGTHDDEQEEEEIMDTLESLALVLDVLVQAVRWSAALPEFSAAVVSMVTRSRVCAPTASPRQHTPHHHHTLHHHDRHDRHHRHDQHQREQRSNSSRSSSLVPSPQPPQTPPAAVACGPALADVCAAVPAMTGTLLRAWPYPELLLPLARDAKYGALELADALTSAAAASAGAGMVDAAAACSSSSASPPTAVASSPPPARRRRSSRVGSRLRQEGRPSLSGAHRGSSGGNGGGGGGGAYHSHALRVWLWSAVGRQDRTRAQRTPDGRGSSVSSNTSTDSANSIHFGSTHGSSSASYDGSETPTPSSPSSLPTSSSSPTPASSPWSATSSTVTAVGSGGGEASRPLATTRLALLDFAARFVMRTFDIARACAREALSSPPPPSSSSPLSLSSSPLPTVSSSRQGRRSSVLVEQQDAAAAAAMLDTATVARCYRALRVLVACLSQAASRDVAAQTFLHTHGTRLRFSLSRCAGSWGATLLTALAYSAAATTAAAGGGQYGDERELLAAHWPRVLPMVEALLCNSFDDTIADLEHAMARLAA